jgi:DNA-binding response OmpR family regulator
MRVLLIEDDRKAAKLLAKGLHEEGFVVDVAPTGETGEEQAFVNEYDVIVLDWLLPGKDGIAVCRALRARDVSTPILMLTARDSLADRVSGLGTGADDYLTKPFDPRELLARIKSVLRRANGSVVPTAGPRVRMGRCVLDLEKHALVDVDGSEEVLSATEFDLLKVFAENPNRPLARDWLLETVGHREMEVFDRAMDLRITRIRRKVEKDPAHPEAIRTVRGVGYMFVPPKD